MGLVRKLIITVMKFLRGILARSPKLRLLLYDMSNEKEFANLYEHEKMLADRVRINCYREAIIKHVSPGGVVLDLGTGTGILSFFAAQQGAGKIYAIDHSDFITFARAAAKENKLKNIEFVQSNSRYFKPDIKFDIIIHEQIGDYLFNENMIQNLLDLKVRLLKPGGRILPGRFELFLEPACLQDEYNIPFIWENRLHGIDFGFMRKYHDELAKYKPQEYKQEWLCAAAVKYFLCRQQPVLSFDLHTLESEKDIPQQLDVAKQVAEPGSLDGFCLFFRVIFDDDISFDTSPLTAYTHWGNCFFRVESRNVSTGDVLRFQLTMKDLLNIKTWSVSFEESAGKLIS